ncbi:MAG: hypothetical protein WCS65_15930 [Verrucomicrobiae bacterium]
MTNILLAIFLLAFIYCLVPGRVPEPWRTRIVALLTLAAASMIGWQFFLSKRDDPGVISAKYPTSAAYVLGRQLRKDINRRGEVVVVASELAKWFSDRQIEGLKQALEGSGLKMAEPSYENPLGNTSALAPGKLEKIFSKNRDAVAIVTFLGVPELREADKSAGLPPIYVFQAGDADDCRAWLEAGLVWGACFYKEAVDWTSAPPRISSLESAFKDRFKLATPGDLPSPKRADK